MPLSDWVTGADGAPAPAQRQLLDELGEMLDDLRPIALDRARSRIRWIPAEYDEGTAAEVTLEHQRRPGWTVRIHAEPRRAVVSWLSARDGFDETDGSDAYPWTSLVVDTVAAILRGEYEVEDTTRLGRWYRTSIIDVSDPANPERLRSTAPLLFMFRRPFPATVTRQQLDFTSS
jgi:hypothetical protein